MSTVKYKMCFLTNRIINSSDVMIKLTCLPISRWSISSSFVTSQIDQREFAVQRPLHVVVPRNIKSLIINLLYSIFGYFWKIFLHYVSQSNYSNFIKEMYSTYFAIKGQWVEKSKIKMIYLNHSKFLRICL